VVFPPWWSLWYHRPADTKDLLDVKGMHKHHHNFKFPQLSSSGDDLNLWVRIF
jgi:hypothetical protein